MNMSTIFFQKNSKFLFFWTIFFAFLFYSFGEFKPQITATLPNPNLPKVAVNQQKDITSKEKNWYYILIFDFYGYIISLYFIGVEYEENTNWRITREY